MIYEYTGKVIHILEPEDIKGQSKIFKRKQTIVCEHQKENKCAFLLFDDKIDTFAELDIKIGDQVNITFSIKARIYKGEWYSNAYCLSITKKEPQKRRQNKYREHKFYYDFSNNKNNNWFQDCITRDDYKKRYRELCKKYHPDLATGDSKIMQEINIEYERHK